ncbi:MAG: penicillin-insensitive murein endopeptidase [Hyphomicrobiaceae bacterium]
MTDVDARQVRIDIDGLLVELQRALRTYRRRGDAQERVDQLRYIQELAAEVMELERLAKSGVRSASRQIERSETPNGLAIVVGHTRIAPGVDGRVPPFAADMKFEYPWNSDLAQRMLAYAQSRGIRCKLFFRDEIGIPGAYREVMRWKPQATLELHFNADEGAARGTETLYKNGNARSRVWAQALQDAMVALYNRTGSQNRGLKPRDPGDRGHESVNQIHPSALVEPFFGDNTEDARLGVNNKDRQAQVLVDAFITFVSPAIASTSFWNRWFSARPSAASAYLVDDAAGTHGPCDVPDDYLLNDEQKWRMRIAALPPVDVVLGASDGLYGYGEAARKYGIRETIDALREVGRIWQLRGHAPRIGIGDISKQGGGQISGHASHRKGIDIDIRPITNNGQEEPTTYQSANHSRALTQELCDLIHANGKLAVQFILFNDPGVASVQPYRNHDNHLHVRHWLPGVEPALPVLALGSRGSTVRELQRRLNFWREQAGPNPALVIDGDFGNATYQAVIAFQRAAGLPETGQAGEDTWRALPTHRAVSVAEVISRP